MKLSRFTASTAAIALVAASALAFAAPANAAILDGAVFVADTDIVQAAPFSNVGWGNRTASTQTSTSTGLSISNDTELVYGFTSDIPLNAGFSLSNAGNSSYFFVSDATAVYGEFLWYADAAHTEEQYLFSITAGPDSFVGDTGSWVSTTAVGSIPAFTPATLSAFDGQFSTVPTLADASLHGVGLYNDGGTVLLTAASAGGNLSYFTPVPVSTAAASIGQYSFGTTGYTATTNGFIPGETVTVYLNTTEATSDPVDVVADATGTVTYTWVAPLTTMDVGTYAINFQTQFTSGLLQIFLFDVIAQSAPAVAPVALAASGTESIAPIAAALTVLLAGVILAFSVRRRRTV